MLRIKPKFLFIVLTLAFLTPCRLSADRVILKKHRSNGKSFFIEGTVIQEPSPEKVSKKAYKIPYYPDSDSQRTVKPYASPLSAKHESVPQLIVKQDSSPTPKKKESVPQLIVKQDSSPTPAINEPVPQLTVKKDSVSESAIKEPEVVSPLPARETSTTENALKQNTPAENKSTEKVITTESKVASTTSTSFGLGINYSFPMLHYQFSFSEHFAIGLTGILMDYSSVNYSNLKGYGGLISLNYYHTGYFEGLWIEGGAGLYQLSLSNASDIDLRSVQALMGHIGWRWKWEEGPSFGFATGAQYLAGLSSSRIALETNGIFPSLLAEIAFLF